MKLWGGRFEKSTNKIVDDFNSSISFDKRLYKQDILGSIAHAKMLGKQGIIRKDISDKIIVALTEIAKEIEEGTVDFSVENEDIHMNIEALLIAKIGEDGKRLHTARSRNDQVALDMKLYTRQEIDTITELLYELLEVLMAKIKANTDTIMPGFTHLQKAQPITFAHHLMAYFEMIKRDIARLKDTKKRMNTSPLGSGALATTTYDIDRLFTARELGFDSVALNSLDGVSDRDYLIELLADLSIIMMHLSRFSEEIILWCSTEYSFITLDDAYSTGSSIMPQKKNPDVAELVRGKTGRVYASLLGLLTTMKGLPLAYNKDMQEDKPMTFDAIDNTSICVTVFTQMLDTMKVNKDAMKKSAATGFTNATDAADYLVKKGLAFRDAHEIIGKLVLYCIKEDKSLDELSIEEYKKISPVFEKDVYEAISLASCVNDRNVIGGPAKEAMEVVITINEEYLKDR